MIEPATHVTEPSAAVADHQSPMVKLSRRMVGFTNNLLATAIVLVVGLGGGRELVSWWRADVPYTAMSLDQWPTIDWSAPLQSCSLQFGNAPLAIEHHAIAGDRDQALAQLRKQCRDLLAIGAAPLAEAGPAEATMLAELTQREPAEQRMGQWRIHQTEEPVPLVVGILDDNSVVTEGSRVVTWGMAVPAADGNWTTYTFHTAASSTSASERSNLLPSGCQRTLSISDAHGATLLGFTGHNATSIISQFDQLAERDQWQTVVPWQAGTDSWQARFVRGESSGEAIEIHMTRDAANIVRGIVTSCPLVPLQEATT